MARKAPPHNSSQGRTETLDLTRMLPGEVTTSGSFDLRRMKTSHFGKLLQAIPLPILLINESLQVVFANDACGSLFRTQRGAAQASLLSLLANSSSAETIDELVREVFTTRKTLTTEVRWEIDERGFWGRMTLRPVRIAGERVVLLVLEDLTSEKDRLRDAQKHETELAEINERLVQEINQRITFEQALREREERYRHLVEHASDGIYSTDMNGFFTFVNATATRMCGFTEEEMLGKHYLEVIHPSHRKRVEEFYRSQFVKRLPHTYYEFPLLTKYGDIRWLGQSAQTIVKGDKVAGFQAVARDITDRKGLEAALRREKERFQVLAEHAPFGMLLVAKDGKFEYVNPKFLELFGYDLSDIPFGKEWLRRAYPDADYRHSVISAWLGDLRQTPLGEARPRTFIVQCKDGTSKIINFITVQLSSGDHIVTCEDITEQTKAREEIQEKERFLAGVFSSIQDGISVLDTDLNIIRVNESAERWYSHAAPLPGKKCYEVYHGADAPCEVCPCRRALETGEPAYAVKARSGPGGETSGWLELYCFPMKDEATGEPKGVIEYARDVTKQREAENELREREQLLSTITATSPVGIGLAQDRRMVWANDAWESMFGFSEAEEYVGKSVRMLYSSEEECDHVGEMLHRNLSSGKTTEVDAQMQRKDGSLFQARMRMRAVDASDPSKGFIAAVTDVTERKRAEEEVRQTKQLLEAVVNATPDIVLSLDKNMIVRLCNASAAEGLGTTTEEIIGKNVADFLLPELAAPRKTILDKVVESGKPFRFEDQQAGLHLDHVVAPLIGIHGQVESVVVIARDISILRQTQEAERQHALLLKTILSASPVGIGLATWDGKLAWVNDAWPHIFGFDNPDELLRQNIRSLFSSQEEFQRVDQIIYHTVWDGGVAEIDATMRRKDGSVLDAFIRASAVDPSDPAKGLIGAITDVTERKRAEEEVRQTKQLLEAVINATPDVVIVVGIDATVRLINSAGADRLGSTPGEMVGRNAAEYLPPDTFLKRSEYLHKVVESGETLSFEDQRSEFHYDHALAPIFDAKGQVEAVVAFARDITERKKAERALKESEEKFRLFMDNSPSIAWMKDEQGRVVYLNKTHERRFGLRLEDWLGKTDFEIWPEEVARPIWENDQTVLRDGQAKEITEEAVNPDGERSYWWNFKFPFQDSSGMRYVAGIGLDITAQTQAQEALRESEERYRLLVDMSPDGIGVYCGGVFLFANEAGARLLGTTPEQILGRPVQEFIHPEFRDAVTEQTRRVLESREGIPLHDAKVVRVDGSVRDVELIVVPITYKGQPAGQLVTRDVTERKRVEEALRRSEEKIAAILAAQTDHMSMLDEDLTILWANEPAQQRFGNDLVGQKCYWAYHRRTHACEPCLVRRCFADGSIHEHETEVITEDGTKLTFWCTATPVQRHEDGNPKLILEISRDISERKRAEVALRESEERLGLALKGGDLGLWDYNLQTGEAVISARRAEIVGYTLEQAEPNITWWGRQVHPEDVQRVRKAFNDHVKGRKPFYECEHRLLHKSGEYVWVLARGRVVEWDERGNPVRLVGTTLDMTERKLTEEALKESEERFREFAEAVPQAVYELDGSGNIVFVNRSALAFGGYEAEDLKRGMTLTDVVAPEDIPRLFENINKVVQGERTSGTEYTLIIKDGTRVPVVAYSSPIVRGNKVVGLRGVCVDITKLKEAEEILRRSRDELEKLVAERTAELESSNHQLRLEILERIKMQQALSESEERFRRIFETARDCVFIKDTSLRYTFVNPYMANLLESAESAIVGKTDADLFGVAAGEHLRAVDSRVLKGEVVEEEHTRAVKGTRLTFLDVKAPLCSAQGEVVGICGISRDITERRLLESAELPTDFQYTSRAMSAAVAAARLAAGSDSTVLLTGESGSGKDYLARYIHDHSSRSAGSFYSINCAAIPSALAESELFGHEAGAFTGATKRKRGLLELAEGGTVLLNEIGELPLDLQAKLLAFLDTRTLTRVGAERAHAVNVRLVAASNKNLADEVSSGRFRQDLFYRLDVFSIGVPPLRERLDDLPALVQELISLLAPAFGYTGPVRLHPRVMDKLRRYSWPGNVRELRNVLERALILSRGGPLRVEHLQLEKHESVAEAVPVSFPMHRPLSEVLDELERSFVEEALTRSGGNKTDAARLLGISRFALARHMRKLGISTDSLP